MADYRQESQEYARGALKATTAINGGAAVAVLTQATPLLPLVGGPALAWSMGMWVLGISLSTFCWLLAFLSTRYVDRSEEASRVRNEELRQSDKYMFAGIACVLLSTVSFAAGSAILAVAVGNADLGPAAISSSAPSDK